MKKHDQRAKSSHSCSRVELKFIGLLDPLPKTSDSNRSIKSVGIVKVVGINWILCGGGDNDFWLTSLSSYNSL